MMGADLLFYGIGLVPGFQVVPLVWTSMKLGIALGKGDYNDAAFNAADMASGVIFHASPGADTAMQCVIKIVQNSSGDHTVDQTAYICSEDAYAAGMAAAEASRSAGHASSGKEGASGQDAAGGQSGSEQGAGNPSNGSGGNTGNAGGYEGSMGTQEPGRDWTGH
jgi:hypothetical protein